MTMLAEIFLLRIESKLRTSQPPAPAQRDPRFVPVAKPRG
jgi:hypothetical protein